MCGIQFHSVSLGQHSLFPQLPLDSPSAPSDVATPSPPSSPVKAKRGRKRAGEVQTLLENQGSPPVGGDRQAAKAAQDKVAPFPGKAAEETPVTPKKGKGRGGAVPAAGNAPAGGKGRGAAKRKGAA